MNIVIMCVRVNLLFLYKFISFAGERVLVRCEAEALHRSLGVRCEGHGAPGRATRFAALATPSCRGKWLRLTPSYVRPNDSCLRQQETDSKAQFIFV